MAKRFCLAVDLKDDPQLIAEYETYHQAVWPAIIDSIKMAGIHNMEIYRIMNRLFMVMETNDAFSFDKKAVADLTNQTVQEWEALMWKYQQSLPIAKEGEKWILMTKIFEL
jgi:L-rhamnose mutarotase